MRILIYEKQQHYTISKRREIIEINRVKYNGGSEIRIGDYNNTWYKIQLNNISEAVDFCEQMANKGYGFVFKENISEES
jgi:hypothetical protein